MLTVTYMIWSSIQGHIKENCFVVCDTLTTAYMHFDTVQYTFQHHITYSSIKLSFIILNNMFFATLVPTQFMPAPESPGR